MVARVAVLVLAVVACAWFVLGVRQTKDLEHATSLVSNHAKLTTAQAARAQSLLNGAGRLTPDSAVDIVRARVALELGHHAAALKILAGVTRDEPKNIDGWLWTSRAATDSHTFYLGLAHIALLEPNVG